MQGFQGAVLTIKLKHIDDWNNRRLEIAKKYNEKLNSIGDIKVPHIDEKVKHVFHLYVIRTSKRDSLLDYLKEKEIYAGIHYPYPLHLQDSYKEYGYKKGDFPIAEEFAPQLLSLPIFPEMTDD